MPALLQLRCPIVTHVHETAASIRRFTSAVNTSRTLASSNRLLAVSSVVQEDLVAEFDVPRQKIAVVSNFVTALPREVSRSRRVELRRELGLPEGGALVVGCGHLDAIKGPDLFADVAMRVRARMSPAPVFAWIGHKSRDGFSRGVTQSSEVHWVGARDNVAEIVGISDAVLVTSRTESFSLVALDAMAAGRPVLGFSAARWPHELFPAERELIVPQYDAAEMAKRLEQLLRSSAADREGLTSRLRQLVERRFLAPSCSAQLKLIWDEVRSEYS